MNLSLSLQLLLQMLHSDIISQPNLPEWGWTNITIDSKRILLSTIIITKIVYNFGSEKANASQSLKL